jgi:hypothetical protein
MVGQKQAIITGGVLVWHRLAGPWWCPKLVGPAGVFAFLDSCEGAW